MVLRPLRPFWALLLGLNCFPVQGADFYVSTEGNDAWSGTTATRVAATEGPFATLDRARQAVRQRKQAGALPKGGLVVEVLAGTYALPATFVLTREDSGTAEAPVTYRAQEGATVRLLGGRVVTGFKPFRGHVLAADLAAQGLGDAQFRQLLFAGRRMPLARYPNEKPDDPHRGGWAYVEGERISMYQDLVDENTRTERKWNESVFVQRPAAMKTLHMKPQDVRHWSRPAEAEVFIFPRFNWVSNLLPVESVEADQRTLHLAKPASYEIRPGDRYFVRGPREELDAPGEWYLDAERSQLLFWPPEPLTAGEVVVPTLPTIVDVQDGAHHLVIQGFTLEACRHDAVRLRNASDCLVAGNTLRNVGDQSGSGVVVTGGRRNRVVGNDIHHTGRHCVSVSGGDPLKLIPAGHVVDNNYLHHPGEFDRHASAVVVYGVGNRVSHNLIHDCPRKAIQFAGNNLVLEYNRIRHVDLETEDTGAIGTSGRNWIASRGSVVRYNFIQDSLGYGWHDGKWGWGYFDWGIYLDDNTGGVDVLGNVVARTGRSCMHLHNARDNRIENNLFLDGAQSQIRYSGWTTASRHWKNAFPHMVEIYETVIKNPRWQAMRNMDIHPREALLPDGTIMSGNVVRHNLFCYRDPQAALFQVRNFSFANNESDYNLVWAYGRTPRTGQSKVKGTTGPNLAPNPGFEEGKPGELPTHWRWQLRPPENPRAGVSTEVAAEGKQSLWLGGASWTHEKGWQAHPVIVSELLPAKLGQDYLLTARMRADREGRHASLKAQSYVANVYFWARQADVTLGPQWQQVELAFRFPAPGEQAYNEAMKTMVARVDMLDAEGELWVDDVVLRQAEVADEWESWQALGMDVHSVVADPKFLDPEHDDYRLQPDSPALKLGFQPLPFDRMGPYKDPLRASWPIVEAKGFRELTSAAQHP